MKDQEQIDWHDPFKQVELRREGLIPSLSSPLFQIEFYEDQNAERRSAVLWLPEEFLARLDRLGLKYDILKKR